MESKREFGFQFLQCVCLDTDSTRVSMGLRKVSRFCVLECRLKEWNLYKQPGEQAPPANCLGESADVCK